MAKILLVEDDRDLCEMICRHLSFDRHLVECAFDGPEGWLMLKSFPFDLLILDWQLPALSGIELCKQFRCEGGRTPILFLTGKDAIDNKEAGFDAGADDYLTKPFQMRELMARVRALLRRPSAMCSTVLQVGPLTLESASRRLTKDGEEIRLSPREFDLLEFFMKHPGQVFSADALLDRLWTSDKDISPDAIRTFIKQLRKKLDKDREQSMIRNIHGTGYRLDP